MKGAIVEASMLARHKPRRLAIGMSDDALVADPVALIDFVNAVSVQESIRC
jgi:hypothetical protein